MRVILNILPLSVKTQDVKRLQSGFNVYVYIYDNVSLRIWFADDLLLTTFTITPLHKL